MIKEYDRGQTSTFTKMANKSNLIWSPDDKYDRNQYAPEMAYQPHFYSGQDCFFFIIKANGDMVSIPTTGFGYGMSQQKIPVFGAWDYRHRGVLKGNAVVQGQFSIVFTKPNFIQQLLGMNPDEVNDPGAPIHNLEQRGTIQTREDLRDIIWGKGSGTSNLEITDPTAVGNHTSAMPFGYAPEDGRNPAMTSGHDPFDILIIHGNDPNLKRMTYESWDYDEWSQSVGDHFKAISTDYNNLSGGSFRSSDRLYIENVELMSSGIQYDITGQPLQEAYSFIARDVKTPNVTPKTDSELRARMDELENIVTNSRTYVVG